MRILFLGTPQNAVPILDSLSKSKHQLVGVVSQPARKRGRGLEISDSEVTQAAKELGIPSFSPERLNLEFFENNLSKLDADIAIVVAFGQILPGSLLNKLPFGWFNIHFSLLPKYRGAAPLQRQIMQGDRDGGISIFKIDEGLDTGMIFAQVKHKLGEEDNFEKSLVELVAIAASEIISFLDNIEKSALSPVNQSGQSSVANKLVEADYHITWKENVNQIYNLIRAGSKNLYAWSIFRSIKLKIVDSKITDVESFGFGVIKVVEKSVLVGCADGVLELIRVIPEGKKQMDAFSWINGIQDKTELKFS